MSGPHDETLLTTLLDYALALPTDFDADAALDRLAETAAAISPGCGCGIIVAGIDGTLRAAAGSDPRTARLEALQVELGEGPCLLAFRTGEAVSSRDLAADERFPRFGPRAAQAGLVAVLSMPMVIDDHRIGAYNLFADRSVDFDLDVVLATRVLASIATSYLLASRSLHEQVRLAEQLQRALDSRVLIEQAKGRLSALLDTTPEAAFDVLRQHSRNRGAKLADVARAVMAGELDGSLAMGA